MGGSLGVLCQKQFLPNLALWEFEFFKSKAIKLKRKEPVIINWQFSYSLLPVNAYWGTTVMYM